MSEDPQDRAVSFPPGETTYTEWFQRVTYPDGTIRDTAPTRKSEGPGLALLRGMASATASRLGGRIERMERTVTVTATAWAPVDDEQAEAESTPKEAGFVAGEDIPAESWAGLSPRPGHGHVVLERIDDGAHLLNLGWVTEDLKIGDPLVTGVTGEFGEPRRIWQKRPSS